MEIGEELFLNIVDLNHDCMGVAKVDGYTIFVEGSLPNETVKAKIKELGKNYGIATLLNIKKKSPFRIKPVCDNFGICGGCELLHLDYSAQLEYKKNMVIETIKRIGHIDNFIFEEIVGMEDPYYYRNKVQMPFGFSNGKVICGYYKKKTHEVVPIKKCYLQSDEITDMVNFIKNIVNEYKISSYNDVTHKGVMRHVMIRKNNKDEYMVVLITNCFKLDKEKELVNKIISRYPKVISIYQNINLKQNNVILGEQSKLLYGPKFIEEEICGLKFNVSYQSFFQVNLKQMEKLYNIVLKYSALSQNKSVIDGYCGVGTISLLLAKNSKHVYGIEIVSDAIKNAKENARMNGIDNASFIVGKVEDKINDLIKNGVDTIVLDPPRKGLEASIINCIINSNINRIVYVSCNVSTLARDLALFKDYYNVSKVSAVDMFCQTSGIETIALLVNKTYQGV